MDQTKLSSASIEHVSAFYEAINRSHLIRQLTPDTPYVYWTMELYDESNGLKGAGGLGVLAADTRRVAERLNVPMVFVTPFYPSELHQAVHDGMQSETSTDKKPGDYGYKKICETFIRTLRRPDTNLRIYEKRLGSTRFICMYEPNFGKLYEGDLSGDHRLYQNIASGFGGYKALKTLGIRPAVIQLNETATIFAAIARLDELCTSEGMNVHEAIVYVRKSTLYTNHTLLQAAESEFSYQQFRRFVFPNIVSRGIKKWLTSLFREGKLRSSTIAIELAECKNGVSKLHAKVADFRDLDDRRIKFHAITNGIDMPTWVLPETFAYLQNAGILDRFGLVSKDYRDKIATISPRHIRELKRIGRREMNTLLARRLDQYGHPVHIPEDVIVFDFKRRFADYKRPYMPFENPVELRDILETYNAHYLLAGKVHPGDSAMYKKLSEVLQIIDSDDVLRQRVHYIADYDETVGRALALGSDCAINIPVVGLEACGTSWEKDIANLKLLISTADGGVADVTPAIYLEVKGKEYRNEVASLYNQMRKAGDIVLDDSQLSKTIQEQLTAYLPVISGVRMMRDYLRYLFT
ncbi:MAG: glycogen/starch/alpha-glucan phosphorylase [Candidatus Saccharimonadales bacterium]